LLVLKQPTSAGADAREENLLRKGTRLSTHYRQAILGARDDHSILSRNLNNQAAEKHPAPLARSKAEGAVRF
jgi:hypothetical protein